MRQSRSRELLITLLLLLGVILLFAFTNLDIFIQEFFYDVKTHQWLLDKKGLIIILLSSTIVPLSVGSLKDVTNMPCPKNIQHFNGKYPDVNVFECYPQEFKEKNPDCRIKCWPAGHASGGFALLSLFFLFKSQRNQKRAVIIALSVGFSMGIYKMLIGDHFFSHMIITMLIAWLIILLIDSLITIQQRRYFAQPAEI